jgi:hypothetical protein
MIDSDPRVVCSPRLRHSSGLHEKGAGERKLAAEGTASQLFH